MGMDVRLAQAVVLLGVLAAGATGLAPRTVAAGDDAAGASLEDGLERCRALLLDEKWAAAEKAMRDLLKEHEGNRSAFGYVDEIEETLRLCGFRQEHGLPDAEAIFGAGVKRFDRRSRKVTLEFAGPSGEYWDSVDDFHIYDVRFAGSYTLTFSGNQQRIFGALVCYDVEQDGGYLVTSGSAIEGYETAPAKLIRMDGANAQKILVQKTPKRTNSFVTTITVARQSGQITVKRDGKSLLKMRDGKYKSGYIGILGDARDIEMKGRVDRHWLRSRTGDLLAGSYAKWTEENWDRDEELPAWLARGPAEFQHEPLTQWPSDVPLGRRRELNRALNFFLDEEPAEFLLAVAALKRLPQRTGLWLRGLADLTASRFRSAERAMSRLLELEPEFRPALVFRGMAYHGLHDRERALADFAAADEGAAQYPHIYAGRALVYLYDGDVDAAFRTLAEATADGIDGAVLQEMRSWVHRARRGPQWTERFRYETEHYVVMSDHGKKLCYDIATLLELSRKRYAKDFGAAPAGAPKSRVYVFAGRDGYLDYAGDLAMDLSWTSGVYLPILRELIIWVPIDRTDLDHTVRHEGFHQYLHNFVEDAPLWFNEGWAENFGATRGEQRRADEDGWRAYRSRLTPLRDLLRMDRATFLANASVNYAVSDDLVRLLRTTHDDEFEPLLGAYFAAIRDGLSVDEAFPEVFGPHIDALQKAFDAWMAAGGK